MLKRIYQELVMIRRELQAIRCIVEYAESTADGGKSDRITHAHNEWRRFEALTDDEEELKKLDALLDRKGLTRQELAFILFNLRVRPGFQKSDFGI